MQRINAVALVVSVISMRDKARRTVLIQPCTTFLIMTTLVLDNLLTFFNLVSDINNDVKDINNDVKNDFKNTYNLFMSSYSLSLPLN